MTNVGGSSMEAITTPITVLTNGNLLLNADGGPAGVGDVLTVSLLDDYADGVLGPGESVGVFYDIGLAVLAPFNFVVDVVCELDGD